MNLGTGLLALGFALVLTGRLQAQDTSKTTHARDTTEKNRGGQGGFLHRLHRPEGLDQGTVTIRTETGAHLRIYREDEVVGLTPEQLKQRSGTKRFYQVRDSANVKVCSDTVAIEAPYESVEVICDIKSGRLRPTAPRSPSDQPPPGSPPPDR